MNNGKSKTQLLSKKCTRSGTTLKRPNSSCSQRSLNKCKSYWTSPNISNSNYSMKWEEQSCLITSQAEIVSWIWESNTPIIWLLILKNGIILLTSTAILIMLGSKRMRIIGESSLLEKSLTGKCWLITCRSSRVRWEIWKICKDLIQIKVWQWITPSIWDRLQWVIFQTMMTLQDKDSSKMLILEDKEVSKEAIHWAATDLKTT